MKLMGIAGRIRMLAALAGSLGRMPYEAEELAKAPLVPPTAPEPTLKTADELEVELPAGNTTLIKTAHALQAIIKARNPALNRKQRRQLAHQLQARATNLRRK